MTSAEYDAAVAAWPELNDEAKQRLAELLRPSGRGLAKIDQQDIDTVLDGIREIAEVS